MSYLLIYFNFNQVMELLIHFFNSYLKYVMISIIPMLLLKRYFNGPVCKITKDMTGQIIIVTGANAGIGLETCKQLISKGATVIFASRHEKRTLEAIKNNFKDDTERQNAVYINLNLESFKSILSFVKEFKSKFNNFDILINNAGAMIGQFERTEHGFERTIGLNFIGGLLLTTLLLSYISKRGRIINVSSKLLENFRFDVNYLQKDIDFVKTEKSYFFVKQYALSKVAQYFFNKFISRYLFQKSVSNDTEFKSVIIHPGVIITDAQGKIKIWYVRFLYTLAYPLFYFFSRSIYHGAQTIIHTALTDYESLENSGYYSDCKLRSLPEYFRDEIFYKGFIKYTYLLLDNYLKLENLPDALKHISNEMLEFSY